MELLLIRHALPFRVTDPNGADPALTPEGEDQAARLAAAVADGRYGQIDHLVSSPVRRALQTAQHVGAAIAVRPTVDERLVELSHGWTTYGAAAGYSDRQQLFDDMNAGRLGANTFDPEQFRARVVAGVDAAARADASAVAVFCHGGVINAYLSYVLGTSHMFFTDPFYTSVSRILVSDGRREVLSLNEIDHLRNSVVKRS
ncbi:histidine phosphatase family protein [Gordonia sp. CPCC 206044]|uniref:histidine phosphatase family protein n=1 Tax=Gordonia sp. CPCC 206044 TaxID=3140793 RepID=UPI003AF37F9B